MAPWKRWETIEIEQIVDGVKRLLDKLALGMSCEEIAQSWARRKDVSTHKCDVIQRRLPTIRQRFDAQSAESCVLVNRHWSEALRSRDTLTDAEARLCVHSGAGLSRNGGLVFRGHPHFDALAAARERQGAVTGAAKTGKNARGIVRAVQGGRLSREQGAVIATAVMEAAHVDDLAALRDGHEEKSPLALPNGDDSRAPASAKAAPDAR